MYFFLFICLIGLLLLSVEFYNKRNSKAFLITMVNDATGHTRAQKKKTNRNKIVVLLYI